MTKRFEPTINLDNRTYFGGREVVAREAAHVDFQTPNVPAGYKSTDVDQVLLTDESTVFQCRKCGKHWPKATSAQVHTSRAHSVRAALKAAEKEIEHLKNGKTTQTPPVTTRADARVRATSKPVAKDSVTIPTSPRRVAVSPEWKNIIQRMNVLRQHLEALQEDIAQLATTTEAAGPLLAELREKAARYDKMMEVGK